MALQDIYITNNLTRRKELLKPVEPGHVKLYACGVTVYDHCHIGHALQAINFDMMRSFLEYAGYQVTYVRNYTDVDDKIIDKAAKLKISPAKLAQDMILSTEKDMALIGVRNPTHAPKVSTSMPEIIAMVAQIVENGGAYATKDGDVYYRVRAKNDYGKLSGRKPDDMRSGTRELVVGDKEDELDFALWKNDNTPDASWDSPWGRGRPGWHIECSAMSKACLGETFDIHGGGRDLIFPHHENEIAQSESANKKPYANIWMHCGLMTIDKQKMSKSLGNHILISDFVKDWPSEVLRLGILQHHYSSNIDFSKAVFAKCQSRLYYYYSTLAALDAAGAGADPKQATEKDIANVRADFMRCMSDDFNSAAAIGELNKHFRKANDILRGKNSPAKAANAQSYAKALREVSGVLGLLQQKPEVFLETLKTTFLKQKQLDESMIATKLQARKDARAAKDFKRSDELRDELGALGIDVMDTPQGTVWGIKDSGE